MYIYIYIYIYTYYTIANDFPVSEMDWLTAAIAEMMHRDPDQGWICNSCGKASKESQNFRKRQGRLLSEHLFLDTIYDL